MRQFVELILGTAAVTLLAVNIVQAQPAADEAADSATHQEVEPLDVKFGRLTALLLRADGSLLAGDAEAKEIKVISPAGELVGAMKLEFGPEAVDIADDGTIYCGGQGQLAQLDSSGHVLKTVAVPTEVARAPSERRRGGSRPQRVSGIGVSDADVFVAFGSGWSKGSKSKLYRFDRQFENPVQLAEGLRGCCQRCDIVARKGVLYIAENAAHRVVLYNRAGEVLAKWGKRSRTGLEGFGACCNPMNLCFGPDGVLYTSESGLGRVKRYTTDGKFLDLVGYVGTTRFEHGSGLAASCSNIAIAVTPDGERVFVMDYKNCLIRVLQKKG